MNKQENKTTSGLQKFCKIAGSALISSSVSQMKLITKLNICAWISPTAPSVGTLAPILEDNVQTKKKT